MFLAGSRSRHVVNNREIISRGMCSQQINNAQRFALFVQRLQITETSDSKFTHIAGTK